MKTQVPDFSDLDTQERLSLSGIRIFANIMKAWGVEEKDAACLLGDVPLETYRALKDDSGRSTTPMELPARWLQTRKINPELSQCNLIG
jgi:hypothetical protein